MKATINDVAALAGVSIKTVSRVINKEPTVRKQTADKVWVAVKELNYQPNLAARNLAGNKSYAIGFIYDNPNAYYVIDMQNGILNECKNRGYDLIIHPCSARSETIIDELKEMVRSSRVAGLVLTPPFSESPDILNALEQLDVELVRIISGDAKTHPHIAHISIDDAKAASNITEHMINYGHERIAFISGDKGHKSTGERFKGYQAALKQNHIRYDKKLVIEGSYSFESGVEGAKQLLSGKQKKPSAIFACNDEIAAGALFAARLMGVEVPEEVSIAGFEDSPFSRQTWPKLTTAQQPNNEIAQLATSMLISSLRRTASGKEQPENRHFEPQIVVRDSTAAH
ncbi:LacI family transcriptional regulator [Sinobacterium caligoides]|uniref:LacI family transcriptional regulator n=1 Tax=Sinobacterium caligoides TaxID=933926 RepID=A0A3N2DNN9_9GAMM|nr:LacI family DNA-binding transcriptional regulator [Sinobacterium caligoides]ROS01423.1 LacI family transcriptional regulator [Sinobacterium caligoides]